MSYKCFISTCISITYSKEKATLLNFSGEKTRFLRRFKFGFPQMCFKIRLKPSFYSQSRGEECFSNYFFSNL